MRARDLALSGDIPDWIYQSTESLLASLRRADPETFSHCLRVGEYARRLARAAGLNEYQQKLAQFAGLLHDIGKMGIDRAIVHKPSRLSEDEYRVMQSHSTLSEDLVKPLTHHEFFAQILPAIRGHHERVDGGGYPDRQVGDEIPLLSRLILVVDTLDAMSENRVYRQGLPIDAVYKELRRCAGTQFDLQLVRIFLESHPYWRKEATDQETLMRVAPPETRLRAA